jgi:hypothetical protein
MIVEKSMEGKKKFKPDPDLKLMEQVGKGQPVNCSI